MLAGGFLADAADVARGHLREEAAESSVPRMHAGRAEQQQLAPLPNHRRRRRARSPAPWRSSARPRSRSRRRSFRLAAERHEMALDVTAAAFGDLVLVDDGEEAGCRPSLSDCSANCGHSTLMASNRGHCRAESLCRRRARLASVMKTIGIKSFLGTMADAIEKISRVLTLRVEPTNRECLSLKFRKILLGARMQKRNFLSDRQYRA